MPETPETERQEGIEHCAGLDLGEVLDLVVARRERPRREDREERAPRETADSEPRQANGGGETIPFDVLPPAIARDDSEVSDEAAEEQPRPRRRRTTRAPRPAEGEGEIAPAA